jgi:glycosyltransferase involved in cell wall biosynthesis
MSNINVSVVLNMHREALYLRPTLLSLDACANEASNYGIKVELIAVFDRPDQDTLDVFHETQLKAFLRVKTIEVDVGSLGLARNAGIQEAEGEFIWTSDGDDLVSSNAIVELFRAACNNPNPKLVVFLDYLVAFGEQYHVVRYVDSKWLTAADFAYQHPYVSRIFIKKTAFDSLSYLDLKVTTGYAYEDWDFNSRLYAAGFEFIVALDTILFYRQRGNSLLRQANAASARIIPHSKLFDAEYFCSTMKSAREGAVHWSELIHARQEINNRNFTRELFDSRVLLDYVADAVQLDPAVEPSRIEAAASYCSVPLDDKHWGFQLEMFYRLVGNELFSDVLLLPWLKPGGAEKYILQILHEMKELGGRSQKLLVITGQSASSHEWSGLLPKDSIFIDVFNAFPMLDDVGRYSMVARALLAIARQGARLHIKASPFADSMMDNYGAVLASHFKVIYYRFSDGAYIWKNKSLIGPWGVNFLRRNSSNIDLLISDCKSIVLKDISRLGFKLNKYQIIYAKCTITKSKNSNYSFSRRLLWASRISDEKRPELVGKLATALRRVYPDMIIEVYGNLVESYRHQVLFNVPGVVYRGRFDSFDSLPVERFDGFIYTSAYDGLPNIVLEALGSGLPVIAPNIGGISEAVIDGETGFLVPDLLDERALIEAYVTAVRLLYSDRSLISEMTENGRRLIGQRHGQANFRERVADVFELSCENSEA